MSTKRFLVCLVGPVVALGFVAGSAFGGMLVDEDFSRGVQGTRRGGVVDDVPDLGPSWRGLGGDREKEASYIAYDPQMIGLRPNEGTIEVLLQRDEVFEPEAVFSLLDGQGERLFVFRIYWEKGALRDGFTSFNFFGGADWYPATGTGAGDPSYDISLGRKVLRGETLYLVLTWGGTAGNHLYVNGREIPTQTSQPFGFSDKIRATRTLLLGAETSATGVPNGAWSMTHSPIRAFRVHDRSLKLSELSPVPFIDGVAVDKTLYGAGDTMTVTLRGAPDMKATFRADGLVPDTAMTEIDDGVYVGSVAVPGGTSLGPIAVLGRLESPISRQVSLLGGPSIMVDAVAPDTTMRVLASVPWAGEIEVSWSASPSSDVAEYRVYRGEDADPVFSGVPYVTTRNLTFTDTAVVPGLEYRYVVLPVDAAGNAGAASEIVAATAVAGDGPALTAITVEPAVKPARPGETVTITVTGQSGGTATVDLGELAASIALTESGKTGVYTGAYTVADGNVGPTKTAYRAVAHLSDPYGSSDLAGPEVAVIGLDGLNDHTPPVVAGAENDGAAVAGFSGALVPGDVMSVTVTGEAGGYASFDVDGVVIGVAMAETEPGTYTGTYMVDWDDDGADVAVTASLADDAGNETVVAAGVPVTFDTRVRLTVTARDTLLPADKKSETRLIAKATDANGDDVTGHELALTLSTTDEYTGVVGGGRLQGREARMDDVDNVEVRWGGVTDGFGEVAATYTAGFAAKTALIIAKDLTTGDVGTGWLNTYVASTVAIELVPRAARGAQDLASMSLTADPAWLTADGRSTSRLKVVLRDLSGQPIDGARVVFALGNDNGRIRVLHGGATDRAGTAEAEYRAGTVAGYVTLTASAAQYGVTASLQIELRADAPAKLELVASAVSLPADGRSTADLDVRVTDIHDNPNIDVPVTFDVLSGSGRVADAEIRTDRSGAGGTVFTAGRTAGTTIVEARHTSRAPTEDELRRIQGTVFVPRLAERQERDRIKVVEWLVDAGDDVVKGQPLVTLAGRKTTWTLTAPEIGLFVREIKHHRDRVELGDTLGYIEVDPDVWKDEYVR